MDIANLWEQLNDALDYAPNFQNKSIAGVDEETILQIESKLGIRLPEDTRDAIKIHNGREHIDYGLYYRLATTDLLPITKWRPYEKEDEDSVTLFFECLSKGKNKCMDKNIYDDARDHLAAYNNITENIRKQSNDRTTITDDDLMNNEAFSTLPCELLIIGEGMDDYTEQYLLSIRSGRIYMAIHNLPEWGLIGTFGDWIQMGIKNAIKEKRRIMKQHENI
ncbi:unnamed protein product [Adineta steineri]|uniref:Knr4/Smi1-like domain-containing protein n=3 Tax=Adineta steineri TaxID=433720 RepID=A0A819SWQ5_9BILA|nr:unnamed protein product [Adineta steineri]CAF4069794.1 unnamed protein product [Adineta steineri]